MRALKYAVYYVCEKRNGERRETKTKRKRRHGRNGNGMTATQTTVRRNVLTVATRKGETKFVSPFKLSEAITILSEECKGDAFAMGLVRDYNRDKISASQASWAHFLAVRAKKLPLMGEQPETPAAPVAAPTAKVIGDLAGIVALLTAASAHKRYPTVRLRITGENADERIRDIRVGLGKEGTIWVTSDASFSNRVRYGKVSKEGVYEAFRADQPVGLIPFLRRFASHPAEVASEYGRLTGSCCFCGLDLDDPRSRELGYGPRCARNHNLPVPY